jgi:hypothetical protein
MKLQDNNEYSSGAGCLTRLYWMFLGIALLALVAAFLLQKNPKFPSFLDVGYLFAVASLVFVRYIDIRYLKGDTGEGTPATMDHWRKYSIVLVLGSLCVWLVIRFLVPLFM